MTKLYEAKNHILLCTRDVNPAEHRHAAAHVIVALDGRIKVSGEGNEYLCRGVMIPPGAPHAVVTNGSKVLVFLCDCTTNVARQIGEMQSLSEACCDEIAKLYAAFEDTERYDLFESGVLHLLGITGAEGCVSDDRIVSAMEYIREMSPERISCREVAEAVHLSQGRFSHLFREQVGMTFASYLLYQRMMRVYAAVLAGASITDAALDAGFASSSHFADVNRRVFGLSASSITRNVVFTKVQ